MELKIRTLTPLWTGGAEAGRMDRLHETGIIGSLRWWYEAILRGLGADVCDPTSDEPTHRCQFDTKAYEQAVKDERSSAEALSIGLKDVCPVCCLFGCTGWKRRFELSIAIESNQLSSFWLATLDQPEKFNHWWLSQVFRADTSRVYFGDLSLQAHFIRGYEHYEKVLGALVSFMAGYGALGSRTQYGFGQFAYSDAYSITKSMDILREQLVTPAVPKGLSGDFYSLHDFWCLACRIPDANEQIKKFREQGKIVGNRQSFLRYRNRCLPVSFDIRYKLPGHPNDGLRQAYRSAHGKNAARQIFGTVQGEEQKWGSRVFVSHLYKVNDMDGDYQLRVWGFTDSAICEESQSALKDMFENNIDISTPIGTGVAILNMTESVS